MYDVFVLRLKGQSQVT